MDVSRLPRVIAVGAPCRRSGKGTIANVLVNEYGYTLFQFAFPIKAMFATLCMTCGIPATSLPDILGGDRKEEELPEVGGLSLRHFAEGVGTLWGRQMFDDELWVNIGSRRIANLLAEGKRVVIEDARFENEIDVAYAFSGCAVYVVRPGSNGGFLPSLASEGHLTNAVFSHQFDNDGTVSDLEQQVRSWVNQI
jgi:hypothetical protein